MALISVVDAAVTGHPDNPPLYREAAAPQPLPPPALKLGDHRAGEGGKQEKKPGAPTPMSI